MRLAKETEALKIRLNKKELEGQGRAPWNTRVPRGDAGRGKKTYYGPFALREKRKGMHLG